VAHHAAGRFGWEGDAMFGWGKKWMKVEGVVVAKQVKSRSSSSGGLLNVEIEEFVVEVRPTGHAAFRTLVQEPRIAINFWKPNVGAAVGLEWDEKGGKVRFDKSDPRTDVRAIRRAQDEADKRRVEEALRVPGGAPALSPVERLIERVGKLHASGDLDDTEQASLVAAIANHRLGAAAHVVQDLEKAAQLRQAGALGDADYRSTKRRMLDRLP
jgi:hypothetical protein